MHFKKSLHFCSQMYKMTAHLLFIIYHFNKQSIYVYISSSSSAGTIAGGVIGGIFGLVAFCTFVAFVCGKICKKQNRSQVMVRPQQPAVYTSSCNFKKKKFKIKSLFLILSLSTSVNIKCSVWISLSTWYILYIAI